jgi:hypothetical protein
MAICHNREELTDQVHEARIRETNRRLMRHTITGLVTDDVTSSDHKGRVEA